MIDLEINMILRTKRRAFWGKYRYLPIREPLSLHEMK